MIKIAEYEENFIDDIIKYDKVIVYGAGSAAKIAFPYIPKIDFFCDRNANQIKELNGIPVITLEQLERIDNFCILVCINNRDSVFQSVCKQLENYNINTKIYNYYHNTAFNCFRGNYEYVTKKSEKPLNVNLISYDAGWILGKFARKMKEELEKAGINASISNCVDINADINHHIAYHKYEPIMDCNDTLMITHVDCIQKINLIKHQLKKAKMGICMSKDTMEKLTMWGVPREKLCYVNPAQDGVIKPKKYVLGITHKTHTEIDYRKNPEIVLELCKKISPNYFEFKIMGSGWDTIVKEMQELGFTVTYYAEFDYDKYISLIPQLDYYLFYGYDEGSMGYLDALAAGIQTIVTPQGYHLDIKDGITYACETVEDFIEVLLKIQQEREKIVGSIKPYTWESYVMKHLEIWNYITRRSSLNDLLKNRHWYNDGIFSVMIDNISDDL